MLFSKLSHFSLILGIVLIWLWCWWNGNRSPKLCSFLRFLLFWLSFVFLYALRGLFIFCLHERDSLTYSFTTCFLSFWRVGVLWLFRTRLVFQWRWFDVQAVLKRSFFDVRSINIWHSWEQLRVMLGIGRYPIFSQTCPIWRSKMTFEQGLFFF